MNDTNTNHWTVLLWDGPNVSLFIHITSYTKNDKEYVTYIPSNSLYMSEYMYTKWHIWSIAPLQPLLNFLYDREAKQIKFTVRNPRHLSHGYIRNSGHLYKLQVTSVDSGHFTQPNLHLWYHPHRNIMYVGWLWYNSHPVWQWADINRECSTFLLFFYDFLINRKSYFDLFCVEYVGLQAKKPSVIRRVKSFDVLYYILIWIVFFRFLTLL